jgi:hypothetical protein
MTEKNPTTDELVEIVLTICDEGQSTRRDGDVQTHLAVSLDSRGMFTASAEEIDFPALAVHLWERARCDDLTVGRFAEPEECVASLLEITIERVQTEALLDLGYLVRRHLRQQSLSL